MKKITKQVFVAGGLMVLVPSAVAVPAAADVANPHAACPGLGFSDHAVHDGPGAVAEIMVQIKAAANPFGFKNSGQIISQFAKAHPGTHDPGCEEALRDVVLGGP